MSLQYLIREPETFTSETQVLFLLHGYGSNEEDLFSFAPSLPEDWLIISFRAPHNTPYEGFSWYDIDFNNPEKFVDVEQAEKSINQILESILAITNHFGIAENKINLAGFSQGGVLAYALALRYPDLFSKIACLSTYPEEKLLQNIENDKKKLQNLRFFVSHGSDDAVIPLEWGRKAADLLYDFGCYFSFREYMSGHGVNQKNYLDLMEFFAKE